MGDPRTPLHWICILAGALSDCDLVVEAIIEDLETKQQVFRTLNEGERSMTRSLWVSHWQLIT